MSGIDDPGDLSEIPEEYAATYRDAYLRALAEEEAAAGQPSAQQPEQPVLYATGAPVSPADLPVVVADDESDGARHWSGRVWLLILLVAVLLLILAAFGLGKLLSDDSVNLAKKPTKTSASTSASQHTSPTRAAGRQPGKELSQKPPAGSYEGDVVPVGVTSATASCTARPGVDSAGKAVSYDVVNAYDEDPSTAWRCDDRGVGQTLTFTLPDGTEVGEVGLIPGYAKNDPVTGADRYAENNRITRVRWTLADGVAVVQRLDPDPKDRQMQTIRVPRTATGSITLEILAVKRGPRNTTAISSIGIGSAA